MLALGAKVKLKPSVFRDKSFEPLLEPQIKALGYNPRNNTPCSECSAPLGVNAAGLVKQGKITFLVSNCRECDAVFGNTVTIS